MSRRPANLLSASWVLTAYLGMVLLAAPCQCLAAPASPAEQAVCCCGPEAKTPCHAPADDEPGRHSCAGELTADCTAAQDDPTATEAPKASADSLPVPAPVAVLAVSMPEPVQLQRLRQLTRAPAPPPFRLVQVRSTVLLT